MSLVVGYITSKKIELAGDSRFTNEYPGKIYKYSEDYFGGGLKVIILSKDLVIAYAGTTTYATGVIKSINPSDNIAEIAESLRKYTDPELQGKDDSDFQFLLASTKKFDRSLQKISDGKISEIPCPGRTWIGHDAAYEKYHEYYDKAIGMHPEFDEELQLSVAQRDALRLVIDDREVLNVGGTPVIANDEGDGFWYMFGFSAAIGISKQDKLAVEIKAPEAKGLGELGVYLHEAKRGALFAPLRFSKPQIVQAADKEEFRRKVLETYGTKLIGGGFDY